MINNLALNANQKRIEPIKRQFWNALVEFKMSTLWLADPLFILITECVAEQ